MELSEFLSASMEPRNIWGFFVNFFFACFCSFVIPWLCLRSFTKRESEKHKRILMEKLKPDEKYKMLIINSADSFINDLHNTSSILECSSPEAVEKIKNHSVSKDVKVDVQDTSSVLECTDPVLDEIDTEQEKEKVKNVIPSQSPGDGELAHHQEDVHHKESQDPVSKTDETMIDNLLLEDNPLINCKGNDDQGYENLDNLEGTGGDVEDVVPNQSSELSKGMKDSKPGHAGLFDVQENVNSYVTSADNLDDSYDVIEKEVRRIEAEANITVAVTVKDYSNENLNITGMNIVENDLGMTKQFSKDYEDIEDGTGAKDVKVTKEEDSKCTHDIDAKENNDTEDSEYAKEAENVKDIKVATEPKEAHNAKEDRDTKEYMEAIAAKNAKDVIDTKEGEYDKEAKKDEEASKEKDVDETEKDKTAREAKDDKDPKNVKNLTEILANGLENGEKDSDEIIKDFKEGEEDYEDKESDEPKDDNKENHAEEAKEDKGAKAANVAKDLEGDYGTKDVKEVKDYEDHEDSGKKTEKSEENKVVENAEDDIDSESNNDSIFKKPVDRLLIETYFY